MEEVVVGRGVRLHRTIVDKGITIPPGCQIGIDREADQLRFTVSDDGVVIVPQGMPVES